MSTARQIVDDVLGPGMTREIWTGDYEKALPVSVQDFELTAVLPAVFYMFRFGCRRGRGRFLDTFAADGGGEKRRKRTATVERVADKLAQTACFEGFNGETERAILGDLLLAFCLRTTWQVGSTCQIPSYTFVTFPRCSRQSWPISREVTSNRAGRATGVGSRWAEVLKRTSS
jgi:hypothetical protein